MKNQTLLFQHTSQPNVLTHQHTHIPAFLPNTALVQPSPFPGSVSPWPAPYLSILPPLPALLPTPSRHPHPFSAGKHIFLHIHHVEIGCGFRCQNTHGRPRQRRLYGCTELLVFWWVTQLTFVGRFWLSLAWQGGAGSWRLPSTPTCRNWCCARSLALCFNGCLCARFRLSMGCF